MLWGAIKFVTLLALQGGQSEAKTISTYVYGSESGLLCCCGEWGILTDDAQVKTTHKGVLL